MICKVSEQHAGISLNNVSIITFYRLWYKIFTLFHLYFIKNIRAFGQWERIFDNVSVIVFFFSTFLNFLVAQIVGYGFAKYMVCPNKHYCLLKVMRYVKPLVFFPILPFPLRAVQFFFCFSLIDFQTSA